MYVERLVLGLYETNCYIVRADEKSSEAVVIDTALDTSSLAEHLRDNQLEPVAVILTHGHADHIMGLEAIRRYWKQVPVYIHKLDANMLKEPQSNLSLMSGIAFATEPADVFVEDAQVIDMGFVQFKVIHTPGHTPGSICLYTEKEGMLFSGDTLFAGSVGRTDFPGGDMHQLISSIKEKIFTLPDETVVYPGHGSRTTIGRERRVNPFVR